MTTVSGSVKVGATTYPVTAAVTLPVSSYPDATNTGVLAGTTLKRVPQDVTSGPGWSWQTSAGGYLRVDGANAVVSGLDISGAGGIDVYAANATISNCKITTAGYWAIGVHGVSGVKIQDCTIIGAPTRLEAGIKDVTGTSEITILRCNISNWESGVQMSRGLLQDSYIHDAGYVNGDHTNGFTDNGGRTDGTMIVRHNTIFNQIGQTDCISFFQDYGVIQNVTADNNYLAGGGYTIYGGEGDTSHPRVKTSNVVITNNLISTRFYPLGGSFGPAAYFDETVASNIWTGNVWADGPNVGKTIPAP